ncbi:MAG: hypothetical protein U0271_09115 [Polyangiaceae bacterium]
MDSSFLLSSRRESDNAVSEARLGGRDLVVGWAGDWPPGASAIEVLDAVSWSGRAPDPEKLGALDFLSYLFGA